MMQIRTRIKQLFSNKNYQGRINPISLIVIFLIASLIWVLPGNKDVSELLHVGDVHAMSCDLIMSIQSITNDSSGSGVTGNGSVTVEFDGTPTSLPSYSIQGTNPVTTTSPGQNSPTFNNLNAGTYEISATFAGETCTKTVTATIQDTSTSSPTCGNLSIDGISNDSSGTGAGNGSISVLLENTNTSPPTSSITYTISGGTLTNPFSNSSGDFSGLDAGNYNIVASYNTASGSCTTNSISQTIQDTSTSSPTCGNLSIDGISNDSSGTGAGNGSISVLLENTSISPPTSSITYTISGGTLTNPFSNSSGNFTGLDAGTYNILASYNTASGSCTTNSISQTIQDTSTSSPTCGNLSIDGISNDSSGSGVAGNGSISVNLENTSISPPTSSITYTISGGTLTNPFSNSSGNFTGLDAGTYNILASYNTASGSCTTNSVSQTIQDTSTSSPTCGNLSTDQIVNDSSGSGASGNGFISVILGNTNTSPPTSNIIYTISGGTLTNPNTTGDFFGLNAGTYNVVASYDTASGTCTTNTISQTIQDTSTTPSCDSNSVASISRTNETSCNSNNGTVSASYNGSGTPVSYELILGNSVIDSITTNSNNAQFTGVSPGTYRVNINYTSSSSATCNVNSTTVIVSAATCSSCGSSTASISRTNETICDADDGTVSASYNGSGTPVSYELILGNSVIDSITTNSNNAQFTGVSPGTYRVNINYTSSSSATCSVDSTNVTVSEASCGSCDQGQSVVIDINNQETMCNAGDGSITASFYNQNSGGTFDLIQGTTVIQSNNTGDFNNLAPGTYYVRAIGSGQTCSVVSSLFTINAATCGTICDNASYTISKNNEQLCNANDGMISMDINLSQDPTMYNLIENGLVVSTSLQGSFSNLNPGTYRVQAVYSNCNVLTDAIAIHAAQCTGGGCDTNAAVTANISNETTCNADNGSLQGVYTGIGTPSQYTLIQGNTIISANNTGVFTPLQPGNYLIEVTYLMPDTTICQETSSTLNIGSATCSNAGCGTASTNEYSFANDIIQSDQCATGVAGNVGRNLDDWEWQCVGNSTVTCQADIRDRDGDGVLDPDDQCIDVYGYEDEQGCPRTTTRRRRSGRGGSITPGVCGNGTRERNEACDDGNLTDYDGCDATCEVEKKYDEHTPIANPTEMIVQKIKNSIISIQAACEYDDVDYNSKLNRFTDISWEDRYDPSYILTLFCITKGYKDKFQRTQPTGIGESIKMVTKVHAIGTNMSFNERGLTPGVMPYTDMTGSTWYAPYVSYGHNRGILQGITDSHVNPRALKALTPISPSQLDLLINNAGGSLTPLAQPAVDTDDLFDFLSFITPAPAHGSANGKYVTRQQAAEIVVSAFPDRFKNYKYLVGNNLQFYQILIGKIQHKSGPDQVAFVRKTIQDLESANRELMGQELEIDVRVILDFLKEIVGDL